MEEEERTLVEEEKEPKTLLQLGLEEGEDEENTDK
jgi:hypothetical protein